MWDLYQRHPDYSFSLNQRHNGVLLLFPLVILNPHHRGFLLLPLEILIQALISRILSHRVHPSGLGYYTNHVFDHVVTNFVAIILCW